MRRSILLLLLVLQLACKGPVSRRAAARAMVATTESAAALAPPKTPVRMIVRTANLTMVVKDAEQALRNITAAAEARGGYLGETKQWRENEQVRATATLRVPAGNLTALLADIRKQAIRVESESISAQDISEEYTDLNAQLVNAEAAEKELRELLATVRQRTQKAADVLEVYNELTKVRGEIERLRGRINYLSQTVSLSTINIELVPDVLAKPVVEPGWRPLASLREAARALVDTMKALAEAGIWLIVYLLPLGLIFVMIALIIRRIWRYSRRAH